MKRLFRGTACTSAHRIKGATRVTGPPGTSTTARLYPPMDLEGQSPGTVSLTQREEGHRGTGPHCSREGATGISTPIFLPPRPHLLPMSSTGQTHVKPEGRGRGSHWGAPQGQPLRHKAGRRQVEGSSVGGAAIRILMASVQEEQGTKCSRDPVLTKSFMWPPPATMEGSVPPLPELGRGWPPTDTEPPRGRHGLCRQSKKSKGGDHRAVDIHATANYPTWPTSTFVHWVLTPFTLTSSGRAGSCALITKTDGQEAP